MTTTADPNPTAADSGRSATATFAKKERDAAPVDSARVDTVARAALAALHDVIREHELTYAEYDALKAWLIRVGEDGEWPLFLDVFVEHVVEEVGTADRRGAVGTIEGPYHVPGAPEFAGEATLPMRDGEPGTPLRFRGTVTDLDGNPIEGATVDLWQADADGYYSQFAPGIPEWNLRGTIRTGSNGRYTFHTVQPAPYQIPTDGATGALISAAGWHAWRPAHLHLKVSAPDRLPVTSQLYFDGGDHIADDVAQAVKPALILRPTPVTSGRGVEVTYDFRLDPA
ncbi:catechol 1,2-dioxygenase [Pseudonocardia sp. TRM90224]|uniref:catechol 1,2-dioxygenase n=1 Tax=Pseudonocardia sp. TRM90224 TaxID=2812678 RepID=UPI001E52F2C5|nr:catechol 1,2-dioxygenase [Pseudonocardia sp. TRM90224]